VTICKSVTEKSSQINKFLVVMHPMELLDDMCHMESRCGQFRNSVSFGARYVHGLRLMHHSLRNHFGSTCWFFREEAQVEARFDLFGDSANLDAR
jgi:hypothetical protein